MIEPVGEVVKLADYRKGTTHITPDLTSALLQSAGVGSNFYVFDPDDRHHTPRVPEVHDEWVTASVGLQCRPSSGSALCDWVYAMFGHHTRYTLSIMVSGTKAGKHLELGWQYLFDTPTEVKRQIDWERTRVCGIGEFFFQNYTGELNNLFIELDWVSAK